MMDVAVTLIPELIKLLRGVVEDPETYKKLELLRELLCKLTGKEIDQNGLITLLEGATQGAAYTGEWEEVGHNARRLRVANGYLYDKENANFQFVPD